MKRIVIRLSEENYEALDLFKKIFKLTWQDLLLGGFAYWYRKLNIDEFEHKLEATLKTLEKQQKN